MTTIAIVILNWNGRNFLEKFLAPLVARTACEGVSFVLIDNGSTDDSCTFVSENYPKVQVIHLDKNYGYTGGYNIGLQQVKADYYVLLNSDVEVSDGWLNPLVALMDSEERVGVCMPKIKDYNAPQSFEYAGAAGGFIDRFGFPFCRGRILSCIEEDRQQYDNRQEVFWATGACMMVRAQLFHELGGFDEHFFAHMEEIDFCWRVQIAGHKVVCEPTSVVYHVGGGTLPNNNPHKLYYNYRNSLYLLYKNLPRSKRFFTFLVRIILDCLSAIVYLFSGKFSFFSAVCRAHFRFWRTKRNLRKTPRPASAMVMSGFYRRSIVWDFFIKGRGKLRFTELRFKV
ncbi:MAG: glycosyltransferase family 2 protein [Bacteroidales bacterium]|nr:glycosyltransferase family 2 protein [Bacteroidales bacterium]MCL2133553.1 glycosyltransferase family 2 protein [Bacteroidales bacterium]